MTDTLSWISLGLLTETSTDFSAYSKDIGIYRAILNGEVVYIGKATELDNGGFRKRLRDYTRFSQSARNYPAGELMYRHRNDIFIEIAVYERASKSIVDIAMHEAQLIRETNPKWNSNHKE